MASLVSRSDSRLWWIKFIDEKGIRRFQSTGFLKEDAQQTRKAWALEAEMAARELQRGTINENEQWSAWVPEFLQRHVTGRSLESYLAAWEQVYAYLRENGINRPRDVTYQVAVGFLKWRTAQKRSTVKKTISINTALKDMKVFRVVMRQAVRLGYAVGNPCDHLGVPKEPAKEKPELSDKDIQDIRAALKDAPDWMQVSFAIALYTGCRFSETRIHFRDIDLTTETIFFRSPKGGGEQAFTIPIPTALLPLLHQWKSEGREWTCDFPEMARQRWHEFFQQKEFKKRGICFHCTRVTYITRLQRAGVPEARAMQLVNHASASIHRIYKRHSVADVRQWKDSVQFPA